MSMENQAEGADSTTVSTHTFSGPDPALPVDSCVPSAGSVPPPPPPPPTFVGSRRSHANIVPRSLVISWGKRVPQPRVVVESLQRGNHVTVAVGPGTEPAHTDAEARKSTPPVITPSVFGVAPPAPPPPPKAVGANLASPPPQSLVVTWGHRASSSRYPSRMPPATSPLAIGN